MIDLRKKNWSAVICTAICIFALGACGRVNDGKQAEHEDLQEYSEGESLYEESTEPEELDDHTMLSEVEKADMESTGNTEEETTFQTGETVEICNYLKKSEDMIKNLNMEPNATSHWFETSYQEDSFIFEKLDTDNFQYIYMCNHHNDNVTLFGVQLGDDIEQAYKKIEEYGAMYICPPQAYEKSDAGKHIYICYQDEMYYLDLFYDSDNAVTSWTLFNFFVGEPDETLSDMLKAENLNRNSMTNWQAAYIQYIKESGWGTDAQYALAYIDEDDIPELIQYGVSFADGGTVSTYSDGEVSTEWIYNQASGESYYSDRGNMFYNCGGHMGLYYDTLYQIIDGEVVVLHAGCCEALDINNEQYKYTWDNVSVDANTYNTNLESCIDKSTAVRIEYEQMVTADEILKQILAVQ